MAFDEDRGGFGGRGGNGGGFQRQMFQGDWACSKCGAKITELPFNPDPSRVDRLLCKDCYRDRRGSFQRN